VDSLRKQLDLLLRLAGPVIALYFAFNTDDAKRKLALAAAAALLLVVLLFSFWPTLVRLIILRRVRRSHDFQQLAVYNPVALEACLRDISADGAKAFVAELSALSKEKRIMLIVRTTRGDGN